MSNTVTIGGDRLGAGKKMKATMHGFERSTHDLSYIFRTTMSAGTLVPFLKEVALPGDTFDIDLDADIKTHPTIGPLFGSYKVQLDVFQIPIRLYNARLHNNELGIGLKMQDIFLPQITLWAQSVTDENFKDNLQVNPSSLLAYLDIAGLGTSQGLWNFSRDFNAVPTLAYWDIYKNYYANKQEEIGAYIFTDPTPVEEDIEAVIVKADDESEAMYQYPTVWEHNTMGWQNIKIEVTTSAGGTLPEQVYAQINGTMVKLVDVFNTVTQLPNFIYEFSNNNVIINKVGVWAYQSQIAPNEQGINVKTFNLEDIDSMRRMILAKYIDEPFKIEHGTTFEQPYADMVKYFRDEVNQKIYTSSQYNQQCLGLKTYQSDLFNNWMSTEWIDGPNGINSITAIDTSDGEFTIDTLILSRKVYDMLNRIAVSGGTYDDWLEAVYDHERRRGTESPVYMGGLIKELIFQEVVSNAEADATGGGAQPLGTLAGKGIMGSKHKGGKVVIKVDEPSYIMGIISLTPRVDYSQGNKWDVNLKTLDDLHKPSLDEIGFQDLITDQMAWWDTEVDTLGNVTFKSAGKQPAWINYMTNVNKVKGNFAIGNDEEVGEMFMTLNRRYERDSTGTIKDLTTYIDPQKFNYIFADTARDAQNFWAQIKVDITARRKMSAKLMPNL